MSIVFVLQNQLQHFLSKQKQWVSGRDARVIYRTPHKDEAINQMFEVSSKDYTQRLKVLACELNEKRLPVIAEEDLPNREDFSKPEQDIDDETQASQHQATIAPTQTP